MEMQKKKEFIHGWLFLIISILIIVISLLLENSDRSLNLFQRSGTIVLILGAYVAYYNVKNGITYDNNLHMTIIDDTQLFNRISLLLIIIGTAVAGYGDLILNKL